MADLQSPRSGHKRRLSGHLNKVEQRAIGGAARRKLWFVLSEDSPYLYWYKAKNDTKPSGKLRLTGAAFTFDPRNRGQFEIHTAAKDVCVLESDSSQSRQRWLQCLQSVRRCQYDELRAPAGQSDASTADGAATMTAPRPLSLPAELERSGEQQTADAPSSTFYVTEGGHLHGDSLRMPPSPPPLPISESDLLSDTVDFWDTIRQRSRALLEQHDDAVAERTSCCGEERPRTSPAPPPVDGRRKPLRLPSFSVRQRTCSSCQEVGARGLRLATGGVGGVQLVSVINSLKERCCDLVDELTANREVCAVLRSNVAASNNKLDALKQLSALESLSDKISFILQRESQLTAAQLQVSELRRDAELLQETARGLEADLCEANASLDAYRDSVRTKEELIMSLVTESDAADGSDALTVGFGAEEAVGVADSRAAVVEVDVMDVDRSKDMIYGYQNQNQFLNNEVLELQSVVTALEARERLLIRKNFQSEGSYYQLKSKYVLLLNHLRPFASKDLDESLIGDLIDAATSGDIGAPLLADDDQSGVPSEPPTDALGFYARPVAPPRTRAAAAAANDDDLLAEAVRLKQKSDDILGQRQKESDESYRDWLSRWDHFLVAYGDKPVVPSADLKALVRSGVPHTYRSKVWKSLVQHWVRETSSELGNGYYEALLRRSLAQRDAECDPSLKQIDLDLSRTLPGNKHFEEVGSEKMEQLRRVLYAYRWHNKAVGYCQGLNRIAAVALLYLNERDAFWFMVAFVEHLQPADYYTPTLVCAFADQQVLCDLVTDKLAKLAAHMKSLEVDLKLFTLSWFLTCFVDAVPHALYLHVFDVLLYEGNKVLFRFALALLKACEPQMLACRSAATLHSCLSKVSTLQLEPKRLAHIAFNELNPFPQKVIESRRQHYLNRMSAAGQSNQ